MALTLPTRESIARYFLSLVSGSDSTIDTVKGSTPWTFSRAISGVAWLVGSRLLFLEKQVLWDLCDATGLNRFAGIFNFAKKGPEPSQGAQAGRVTGTPGAEVPVDLELVHSDGSTYLVKTEGGVIGVDGFLDVDILAVTKGASTNKLEGDVLTMTEPPLDVDPTVTLVADLQYGSDNEDPEVYRQRLSAHVTEPPQGGAVHDYVEWALDSPGVSSVYVWRHRRGLGTINLAVLGAGAGASRKLTILSDLDENIEEQRPAGARDFLVLTTETQQQNVTVHIDQPEKYKWDWQDNGLSTYLITAHNAVAHTITVPTAPVDLRVGCRLQVRGEELRVISIAGGGVLTLSGWFAFGSPTDATDFINASGDLVVPVRNAILALFNRLGPARDARYAATSWASSLLTDDILAATKKITTDGYKAIVDEPVDDVTPVDALNGATSVRFLVPGFIRVFEKGRLSDPLSIGRVFAALQRHMPPQLPSDQGTAIGDELYAHGGALGLVVDIIDGFLDEYYPDNPDGAFLPRWEAAMLRPSSSGLTNEQRSNAVLARLRRVAGPRLDQLAIVLAPLLACTADDLLFLESVRETIDDALTETTGDIMMAVAATPRTFKLGAPWPGTIDNTGVRFHLVFDTFDEDNPITITLRHPSGANVARAQTAADAWYEERVSFLDLSAGHRWSITVEKAGTSGTLLLAELRVSNNEDAGSIYYLYCVRNNDLEGDPDLVEAQRVFVETAHAHNFPLVCEQAELICDVGLCDREPMAGGT